MSYGTVQVEKMTTESGYSLGAGNASSFKNRIINGAMMIDQRNAGASVTPTAAGYYSCDRWRAALSEASKYSVQQSSTAPSGFINSALITSLSAYSVGATENFRFEQFVEGFNVADLGWGTANAQPVTLSFWVRSSLTGTFGGAFLNSAESRSYPFSYTISAANTWEQKSITVAGDTSGTWLTNNGIGIRVSFSLGAGSSRVGTAGVWTGSFYVGATGQTNLVGTSGATLYITGVQLEVGTVATSFDYRDYGRELILCQRYFETVYPSGIVPGAANYLYVEYSTCTATNATGYLEGTFKYTVVKRASPTITAWDVAGNIGKCSYYVSGVTQNDKTITVNGTSNKHITWYSDNVSTKGGVVFGWSASAEL
jgi:hypothetical protein